MVQEPGRRRDRDDEDLGASRHVGQRPPALLPRKRPLHALHAPALRHHGARLGAAAGGHLEQLADDGEVIGRSRRRLEAERRAAGQVDARRDGVTALLQEGLTGACHEVVEARCVVVSWRHTDSYM